METLAKTLGRSVRTIQRHLHLLRERGVIEFVERRRNRGRFSSYLYRVVHITRTTGHGRRVEKGVPINKITKRSVTPPDSPPKGIRGPKKSTKTTKNGAESGRHNDEGKAMSGYLLRERFATELVSCA
jgi:DNA-binding transcriptional MocR family regulator